METCCYFVTDGHRYERIEDALTDATARALRTNQWTTVLVYAPDQGAAERYLGSRVARLGEHVWESAIRSGWHNTPIQQIQIKVNTTIW